MIVFLQLQQIKKLLRNNNNNNIYDEITSSSVTSSDMLSAHELMNLKSKIAKHLNNEDDDINKLNCNKRNKKHKYNKISSNIFNIESKYNLLECIPICLLCQRCSRTIVLCESM